MKTIALFTLLFCVGSLYAQETEKRSYIPIKAGVQFVHLSDLFTSPNVYKGNGMVFGIGQETYSRNAVSRTSIDYGSGTISSMTKTKYKQSYGYDMNRISYEYLPEYQTDDYQVFVGLQLKISFEMRNNKSGGNSTTFGAYSSLAAVGSVAYNDGSWRYEGNARLPLLAYAVRPQHASPFYFLSKKPFKTANKRLLTIPRFFAFELGGNATHFLETGSAIRFNYNMNYYQITPVNKIKVLTQDLGFDLLWRYE